MQSAAVVVESVSKQFAVPHERVSTLKERALHPFKRIGSERLHALEDVSFAVEPGEFFGIVGRNGSGKSTLLKCLAGIYRVDQGQIDMRGRLSTFIELGVGFNPDLAARDNVLINGIMLGLSPKEALRRFDRVIEFAELEEFVDLKLKNYSSGMQVRLAFSVMIQVDADILLIDEVLAVGDASFQQKCFEVFQRMKDEGRTILFVTHDMGAVKRFCDRALLLERGRIDVDRRARRRWAAATSSATSRRDGRVVGDREEDRAAATGAVEIARRLVRGRRPAHGRAAPGRAVHASRCASASTSRSATPVLAFLIENDRHDPLFATSSEDGDTETGVAPRRATRPRSPSRSTTSSRPGACYATPWVIRSDGGLCDRRARLATAMVTAVHRSGGLVDLRATMELPARGEGAGMSAPAAPDRRPFGARRELPPLRLPRGDARGHRLQAALLRLRARLLLAARAAAAAVRRPLLRLHASS